MPTAEPTIDALQSAWEAVEDVFSDDTPVGAPKADCPKTAAKPAKIPAECSYLEKPYTVEAPKEAFDRTRGTYKCTGPKKIKHKFPGDKKKRDVLEYEVETKGQKVKVIMPDPPDPKEKDTHLPTHEQVAESLASTPGPQLESIKQVQVSPNRNPSDGYWAKAYKKPGFRSVATGGESGVTYYPKTDPYEQAFVDSTTIHEGGHAYSDKLWKDKKKEKAWKKAMKEDGRSPSKYADNAATEDFSESLVMYSLSNNTKCEKFAKQLYPHRYAIMEEMFEKPFLIDL